MRASVVDPKLFAESGIQGYGSLTGLKHYQNSFFLIRNLKIIILKIH
jgi:hypothetical protein